MYLGSRGGGVGEKKSVVYILPLRPYIICVIFWEIYPNFSIPALVRSSYPLSTRVKGDNSVLVYQSPPPYCDINMSI